MPKSTETIEHAEVWLVIPDRDGNPVVVARTGDEKVVQAVYDKTRGCKWDDGDERWVSARHSKAFMVSIPEDPSKVSIPEDPDATG